MLVFSLDHYRKERRKAVQGLRVWRDFMRTPGHTKPELRMGETALELFRLRLSYLRHQYWYES